MTNITSTQSPPENKSVLEEALKDLKRRVHITKDIRFQASLRLARRQTFSNYIISLFSLYVIALSLIPNIFTLNQQQSQILLSSSIILSVFIIFTSLIDGSRNFYHQGDLLHQCARKISNIHYEIGKIDTLRDSTGARIELDKLQKRYQSALNDCPINHENIDYYNQVYRNPILFPTEYNKQEGIFGFVFQSKFIIRQKFRLMALVGEYIWMTLHSVAFIGVTWIVYRYIVVPTTVN